MTNYDNELLQLQQKVALKKKLEGKSLANYFYQVVGKLDDKLTQERRQAADKQIATLKAKIEELVIRS